ncbi:MAG: tripartite tricarboxylate transporter permease [Pelagibacterium sp.]|jgi:TctA family transporter|uniref:tripartite tricarboxylate transporter permease n=1 Tax=Pelagibacterium sp. TaxID=1967288 RepID=UPI0032EB7A7B|tara:strand:- start:26059 stop:27630 length:1572 start_codon:yes stop_codon:yes gene_type:complete
MGSFLDTVLQSFSNLGLGFETAFSLTNLGFISLGVLVGMFVGVLPGIGSVTAIALLLPITYHLGAESSLIMLAGIWYGSTYGGSITSILLNIPGTTANAVTCIDGYKMTEQGRGSTALFTAVIASFLGGSFGIIIMMLFTVPIAQFALGFSSVEYFALIVLGLVAASSIGNAAMMKGLAMVVVGIMVGVIGTDLYTGYQRFTFGNLDLITGVSLVSLSMGVFGIAEIIMSIQNGADRKKIDKDTVSFRAMLPQKGEWGRIGMPILRASGIGSILGALPGTGPAISAYMAYALESRIAKDKSRIGNGAIEGVATPEAANNAADVTSFIPTLALGIPGSATMALMIGALIINGVSPGPQLMNNEPGLFWGLIVSFWIGSLLLLVLCLPLVSVWVRLLMVPFHLLMPAILVFVCIGAYSVHGSPVDVWLVAILGILGYLARMFAFPQAPLILGFVLGPMLEEHFRRAMLISRGDFGVFFESTTSAVILAVTAIIFVWGIWSGISDKRRAAAARVQQAAQGQTVNSD